MKKIFIYASMVGLAAGAVGWLCRKKTSDNTTSKAEDKKVNSESTIQEEEISQSSNVVEKMYQTKSESTQAVHERHMEAGKIMKDAYINIMEDFIEDCSAEKETNGKDKNKEVIIDNESVSVMKEMDLISDELEDLLK